MIFIRTSAGNGGASLTLRKARCFSWSAGKYGLVLDCCFVSHAVGHGDGDDDCYAVITLCSA